MSAGEVVAQGVPTRDFLAAYGGKYGLKYKVCADNRISGSFNIDAGPDVIQALAEAGRRVVVAADGTIEVDCSASDTLADPLNGYVTQPLSQAVIGTPVAGQGAVVTLGTTPQAVKTEPDEYRTVTTKRYGREKFDPLEALGLRVLGDPDVPGPLMLVGPAKIVAVAEGYIRAVDVCPRQLLVEATVVTRSNSNKRERSMGVRIGSDSVGFGTAGTADTGINLSLLSAFLEANRGIFEASSNSTFRGRVIEGAELKLADGQDVPVRSATTVTDRETRQDVVYRTAGHQLGIRAASLDDGEAILIVDHSISALGSGSDLGPSFVSRSTSSSFRVRYREPVVISISGADSARREKARGILYRSDQISAATDGAFLVLAVDLDRCGAAAGEAVQPKAAPQRSRSTRRAK